MSTVYQTTFIDDDGTKWQAIPTNKAKNKNFDIYRNGIKEDYGAKNAWDIEQTINIIRESYNFSIADILETMKSKRQI